jgi:hypothetical protein
MRFSLLSCVALAACTTANTSAAPPPSSSIIRVQSTAGGGGSTTLSMSDGVSERKVAGPPDQVFKLLPSVLDSLGIPVNTLDPAKRTIGNSGFNLRGKLKGVSLSRYIECGGATQMGPNADSYSINLQFMVEVHPASAGSSIVTTLQAMGKPLNYAQDYSLCTSKGNLENRVVELLAAKM